MCFKKISEHQTDYDDRDKFELLFSVSHEALKRYDHFEMLTFNSPREQYRQMLYLAGGKHFRPSLRVLEAESQVQATESVVIQLKTFDEQERKDVDLVRNLPTLLAKSTHGYVCHCCFAHHLG